MAPESPAGNAGSKDTKCWQIASFFIETQHCHFICSGMIFAENVSVPSIEIQVIRWQANPFLHFSPTPSPTLFHLFLVNSFFEVLLNVLPEQGAYPGNSLRSVIANAVKQSSAGAG
jgi:hypothetical protein